MILIYHFKKVSTNANSFDTTTLIKYTLLVLTNSSGLS